MADDYTNPTDDELAALIRSLSADDHALEKPPAAVWVGIEAAGGQEKVAQDLPSAQAVRPFVRRRPWFVAAAAAVLVVLTATGSVIAARSAGRDGTTIAVARLSSDDLPGAPIGRSGSARIVQRDGRDFLRVDNDKLAARSGEYLELWLIDTKVSGMVSLGIVDGKGEYELPSGFRYTDFPIVDISSEPYDGKPTHSGASLLRGTLV